MQEFQTSSQPCNIPSAIASLLLVKHRGLMKSLLDNHLWASPEDGWITYSTELEYYGQRVTLATSLRIDHPGMT